MVERLYRSPRWHPGDRRAAGMRIRIRALRVE